MDRLTFALCCCFFISLTSSCTVQRDYIPLNLEKLEIVNNVIESQCLNKFDNDVLITVLENKNISYVVENNKVYVERRVMNKKDFFDNINRDIQNELSDDSIPKGYVPFKYRRLNIKANIYETRPLDDLDKALLPDIVKKNGFKYILKNDCLYVEKELIENQDFLSKAVGMLDFERGEGPDPYRH